jgi:hypothetical protein
MDRGGQAPRPANDIKHGKMAVVGLARHIWPISNTPFLSRGSVGEMDLGGARLLAREAVPLPAEHGSARRCPYTFF